MACCNVCSNMMTKITENSGLKFVCKSACGTETKATTVDSRMLHESTQNKLTRPVSGKTIYFYASNPKSFTACPKCKYPITAWIQDQTYQKTHGCQCGYSWIDVKVPESKS
jgi:DNA-directed RNA polymerase subunit M/transcription elongation factor TFIIS